MWTQTRSLNSGSCESSITGELARDADPPVPPQTDDTSTGCLTSSLGDSYRHEGFGKSCSRWSLCGKWHILRQGPSIFFLPLGAGSLRTPQSWAVMGVTLVTDNPPQPEHEPQPWCLAWTSVLGFSFDYCGRPMGYWWRNTEYSMLFTPAL